MMPLRSERHFPRQLARLLPIWGLFPPAPRRPAPSTVTSVQDAARPTPLALSGARLGSSLGHWGGGRCGETQRDGILGPPSLWPCPSPCGVWKCVLAHAQSREDLR